MESIDYFGLHIRLAGTKELVTLTLIGITKQHNNRHKHLTGDPILYEAITIWSLAALSNLAVIIY